MIITINFNRAIENQNLCALYADGQHQALAQKIKNPEQITTNNNLWFQNPSVYLLTAKAEDTELLVGGVRLHLVNDDAQLPFEKAVGYLDREIGDYVADHHHLYGAGEVCGLWSSLPGHLIAEKLMVAAIAVCNRLPLQHLFCFPGQHMFDFVERFGFYTETAIGDGGYFYYPDEHYLSRVVSLNFLSMPEKKSTLNDEVMAVRQKPQWKQRFQTKGRSVTYQFHCDQLSLDIISSNDALDSPH